MSYTIRAATPGAVGEARSFPLGDLPLEITETAIMADPVRAKKVLTELREAGIHLLDGRLRHWSVVSSYLKELPISKMRRSTSPSSWTSTGRAMWLSCVLPSDLARNIGLQVTAEGIESEAVHLALRELGCDVGPGLPLQPALWRHLP